MTTELITRVICDAHCVNTVRVQTDNVEVARLAVERHLGWRRTLHHDYCPKHVRKQS